MFHVERTPGLSAFLRDHALGLGIDISKEQSRLLLAYEEQLRAWNRTTNLTSITDEKEIIVKHLIDSLAALRADDIPYSASLLDVGTGAGLPGIPLAIMRPDLKWTLLEPVLKKSSFLHYVVGLLKLPHVMVKSETIEQFSDDGTHARAFDYVVSRALRYETVLEYAATLLKPGGKLLLFLSRPLDRALDSWQTINEFAFSLPCQAGTRVIVVLGERSVPRGTLKRKV